MKKHSARILSLAMILALLLSACGGGSSSGAAASGSGAASQSTGGTSVISPAEPVTINVLTYRNPANEFFVEAMKEAAAKMDNVTVEVKMGDYAQYMEQSQLAFTTQTSPYHLIYAYDEFYARFTYNDWLAPVGDYIEKYREEYEIDDIPDSIWNAVTTSDGDIYCIPYQQNLQFYLYRTDIFEKYDLEVPETFDELFAICDTLKEKEDVDYPLSIPLAMPDTLYLEYVNALHSCGGALFDENNVPTFNGPEGVQAVELLKKLVSYMPPGALTQNTDDTMVGLQQGQVVTSNMWATRIAAMEDDTVSNYVGLFATAPAPVMEKGGVPYSNLALDMWVIPKNIDIDPEIAFVIAMESLRPEKCKEAAPYSISIRTSVMEDEEIVNSIPYYKAAVDTINLGAKGFPPTPAAGVINEMMSYWLSQAIDGNMDAQQALDEAAKEIEADLRNKGYVTE